MILRCNDFSHFRKTEFSDICAIYIEVQPHLPHRHFNKCHPTSLTGTSIYISACEGGGVALIEVPGEGGGVALRYILHIYLNFFDRFALQLMVKKLGKTRSPRSNFFTFSAVNQKLSVKNVPNFHQLSAWCRYTTYIEMEFFQ